MLVRTTGAGGTRGEQALAGWLSEWTGAGAPRGVALTDVTVRVRGTAHRIDAVIWTPTTCSVVDVEHLADPLSGGLSVPLFGPWTVSGRPVRFAGGDDRTPLDQSRDHTFAMQSWLADNGIGQHTVHGLVLVIPAEGSQLRLRPAWSEPGFAVVLGDGDAELREHLAKRDSGPRTQSWTANDIASAFHALGLATGLPSPEELRAEGFGGPIDPSLWASTESPVSEAPTDQIPQGGWSGALYDDPFAPVANQPVRLPYSPWALYPKVPGDPSLLRALARITLATGMLIVTAWTIWFVITALFTLNK